MKEKASQSNSRAELVATMGTPVFLKFARLVSAVLFIRASADFIYASLSTTTKRGIVAPDFDIVEAARTQSVYMSSGLQLFDNVLVFGCGMCCATSLTSLHALADFLLAYTGRISIRYGSSLPLQVRPLFRFFRRYAHTLVGSHQHRCPRRACPTSSGPSARIISSQSFLTPCSSPWRPSCPPVTPRHSSTRQK